VETFSSTGLCIASSMACSGVPDSALCPKLWPRPDYLNGPDSPRIGLSPQLRKLYSHLQRSGKAPEVVFGYRRS